MKSHSMHSHKPFKTQGTQTILFIPQNTLNSFKQAYQNSTLTNNYFQTSQICPQTLKTLKPNPLNSKRPQTLQISFSTLKILKFYTLEV